MEILELKNTVSEMKNSLESLIKILDMRIKRFCELKDKSAEIIQTKAHREKKILKQDRTKHPRTVGQCYIG